MKNTTSSQVAARNSATVRNMAQPPVVRAVDLYTEPQIGALHRRAGNATTASVILEAMQKVEDEGYRLCKILRDIKFTCERTLRLSAH